MKNEPSRARRRRSYAVTNEPEVGRIIASEQLLLRTDKTVHVIWLGPNGANWLADSNTCEGSFDALDAEP